MKYDLLFEPREHARSQRASSRSCYNCRFLRREVESWEMPHIWWWECTKKDARSMITSFPYLNTKCPDYAQEETV